MDFDETYIPFAGWFAHEKNDYIALLLNWGFYEYEVQAFLWCYLRENDTFIDCGAQFGFYTVLAGKIMGNAGRVLGFEPNPAHHVYLEKNLLQNEITCARILPYAVGSRPGSLYFSPAKGGKSAFSTVSDQPDGADSIAVPATTLDNALMADGIESVGFLKVDVEGFEMEVLKGAAKYISKKALPVMMLEFNDKTLARVGCSIAGLFEFLDKLGYTVCRFDEESLALAPIDYPGPGYFNFFAALDPDEINARLKKCDDDHVRIARSILLKKKLIDKFIFRIDAYESYMDDMLRSRGLRLGWSLGIMKKPGWVDHYLSLPKGEDFHIHVQEEEL